MTAVTGNGEAPLWGMAAATASETASVAPWETTSIAATRSLAVASSTFRQNVSLAGPAPRAGQRRCGAAWMELLMAFMDAAGPRGAVS